MEDISVRNPEFIDHYEVIVRKILAKSWKTDKFPASQGATGRQAVDLFGKELSMMGRSYRDAAWGLIMSFKQRNIELEEAQKNKKTKYTVTLLRPVDQDTDRVFGVVPCWVMVGQRTRTKTTAPPRGFLTLRRDVPEWSPWIEALYEYAKKRKEHLKAVKAFLKKTEMDKDASRITPEDLLKIWNKLVEAFVESYQEGVAEVWRSRPRKVGDFIRRVMFLKMILPDDYLAPKIVWVYYPPGSKPLTITDKRAEDKARVVWYRHLQQSTSMIMYLSHFKSLDKGRKRVNLKMRTSLRSLKEFVSLCADMAETAEKMGRLCGVKAEWPEIKVEETTSETFFDL